MLKDFYRNNSKGSVKVSDIRFYSPEADSLWNIMNLEKRLQIRQRATPRTRSG